jgi:chaperone required for assembly of F1-ATPase
MKPNAPTIRRFYKSVTWEKEGRSWTILLDEKTLRTPARAILRVPTLALAQLLAAEWEAQTDTIQPDAMPMTKLANVAADHMGAAKASTAGELVRFASGDVLCFRVEEPLDLRESQAQKWDPLLDWSAEKFGARMGVTTGLRPPEVPLTALENMRNTALEMEPFLLTALVHATSILGSAVLGFAMADGKLDAKAAFDLSRIEEDWQSEHWGADDEAVARAKYLFASLRASGEFMRAAQA